MNLRAYLAFRPHVSSSELIFIAEIWGKQSGDYEDSFLAEFETL
jgi:hypothetical protein